MMQLMFGFCRNSNCTEATVKKYTSEGNFETLNTAFMSMCLNYNLQQLTSEELQAYGVDT